MMLGGIGLFKGIMAKMDWLDQNQRVISQNVANSDTPGYRPQTLKDVDFKSYFGPSMGKDASQDVKMAATNGQHFGAQGANGNVNPGEKAQRFIYEASPDDNGVVIEEQLFKANTNSINYQLATDLYRRNVGMIRMVLQGSRS